MEYSITIAIVCLIFGFLLCYFLFKQNNTDNLSKDIKHLLELQKKDWEKGQIDFKGVVNPLQENLKSH